MQQTQLITIIMPTEFADRKRLFLGKYKSPTGKTKYKRCVNSTLRYAGGKSLAVGLIVELFPDSIKKIVSPFFGGGAVEIACAKELGLPVVGYDIFDILTNFWDVQINYPEKLYEKLKEFEPTRSEFKRIKGIMKLHWDKEKIIKNKYDLAALYYFNHNTSYGPGFLSWPSNVYMNKEKYKSMIEKVRDFRADTIEVRCASFEEIMPRHKNDFLYCDPPYYLRNDSKMFRGIYPQRNFPIHHNDFKHELLRDLLNEHQGGFILSYNDCSAIREWYKNFEIREVKWQYTMGQGETRIGLNRINGNRNHVKQSHEILITKT